MKIFIQCRNASAICALLILLTVPAMAEEEKTEQVDQTTIQLERSQVPATPGELTPEEIAAFQSNYDSLAADSTLQQMAVGATIDGTTVLSVLLALVIFAVLVTIL